MPLGRARADPVSQWVRGLQVGFKHSCQRTGGRPRRATGIPFKRRGLAPRWRSARPRCWSSTTACAVSAGNGLRGRGVTCGKDRCGSSRPRPRRGNVCCNRWVCKTKPTIPSWRSSRTTRYCAVTRRWRWRNDCGGRGGRWAHYGSCLVRYGIGATTRSPNDDDAMRRAAWIIACRRSSWRFEAACGWTEVSPTQVWEPEVWADADFANLALLMGRVGERRFRRFVGMGSIAQNHEGARRPAAIQGTHAVARVPRSARPR